MTKCAFALYLLLPGFCMLPACQKDTDEDKVKKVIAAVQKATEEKNLFAVQEHISRSYRDPQGNDFNAIKALFSFYFFRHRTLAVAIPSIEVAVNGPWATADFIAVLSAKNKEGETSGIILPDTLGTYRFAVSFQKEETTWKVVSAKWERVGDQGEATQQ